ncbi:winged helix-turn-helix transcriptional regulator [Metabacillus fastidiosus]|uniref:LexA family protein n=1 Tax=Metabacillus fastidiosus TaxID=1458 RepID=UPI003D269401
MLNVKLTKKQEEVLKVISNYIDEEGISPSYRELAERVNLASPSTVKGHLERLKQKGYITFFSGQPRTLKVLKTAHSNE